MTFVEFAQFFGDFTLAETTLFAVGIDVLIIFLIAISSYIGVMRSKKFEDIPGTKYAKFVGYKWFGIPCMISLVVGSFAVGALLVSWSISYISYFSSCTTSFAPIAAGHVTVNMGTLSTDEDKRLIATYLNDNPVNVTICQERKTLRGELSEPFVYSITIDKNNSFIHQR